LFASVVLGLVSLILGQFGQEICWEGFLGGANLH